MKGWASKMSSFKLPNDPEGVKTRFTPYHLNRFRSLSKKIVIVNGVAYLPINELHGVLLTNSKKTAIKIVNNHNDIIKNYLIKDKVKFPTSLFSAAIKPMGICLLLDKLAEENPKRALEYRESIYILGYIVASNPDLQVQSWELAQKLETELKALMVKLKRIHTTCQLSGREFQPGEQKHVHHIESKACHPALMAVESNLIVITKEVHDDYHTWVFSNGGDIDRPSLIKYAESKGYSITYTHAT
jgi:hypothetical protein